MDILKKCVIVLLLLMPVGELGRYLLPSIGSAPLVLNDVLVGVTLCVWIFLKMKRKEAIQAKLWFPIVLFIGVACVSLLVNSMSLAVSHVFVASLYIIRWSMYAGLYLVVSEFDGRFKQKLLFFLIGVGQVMVGVGYVQYFLYPSLRNLYYLGWDEHLYRLFSVFFDPNFAGVFFVLVLLLTLGQAVIFYEKKRIVFFFMLLCFVLLDGIAIYLTYSRSALLMFIVSSSVFLCFYGKKKFILGVILILILGIFLSPKSLQTEGTNIFRTASSESRVHSAQTALEIIRKNPVLGVGFNAYRYAQKNEGGLSAKDWDETHAGAGTDNSFLFVLATTGIIGFGVYLFLWFRVLSSEVQSVSRKNELRVMAMVRIASVVGVFVSALFINSLFYLFIMEWLWILIGTKENT